MFKNSNHTTNQSDAGTNVIYRPPGTVFMKGLSEVLSFTFVQKQSQLKPVIWLRPFMHMTPGFLCRTRLEGVVVKRQILTSDIIVC